MAQTISGTYTGNVTLTGNPATITNTATISGTVASVVGVEGPAGTSWTVTNQGFVSESGGGGIGISLASSGTINDASGGIFNGAQDGALLAGGGLVSSQSGGTISGIIGVTIGGGTGTVANAGSISGNLTSGAGISLSAGGSVTNLSGGTISGSYGVGAASVAATVVNAGSIGDGTSLPTGAAIALKKGGVITNQAGGQIVAGLQAIYFGGAIGTVINAGSIGGGPTTGNGIIVTAGVVVTNQSGGVITAKYGVHAIAAAATVVNYGSIGGNLTAASATGIALGAGGAVTNQSGGTITGLRGVAATGGSVINAGSIGGNGTTATGAGIQLISGAGLSNQSGGTISGFAAVYAKFASATVVNSGSIGGSTASGSGVRLTAGGAVTNLSGGAISGFDGILTAGGATVVNTGSIGGTTAVSFGAGAADLLVANPGAVFAGLVDGGNTIGAAFVSTLELASAASAGTLGGLGNQFVHFARTTIDANASWTLSGSNTLVGGATLTNSGTLTDAGTLVNGGTLAGNRLNLNGGVLTNQAGAVLTSAYIYGVAPGAADTVANLGSIINSSVSAIYLKGSGAVTNAAGATITGFGMGVKLGGTAASVSNLGQINATQEIGSYGLYLRNGGMVTNGQAGAGASTASIQGAYGVSFNNAAGTLGNYGTILGNGGKAVDLGSAGGTLVNGASGATAALINGSAYGVYTGVGSVINDATIIAAGTASQNYGVAIHISGMVSNVGTGSLIEGNGGVQIGTDGTVANAGTIESNQGTAGVAVDFIGGNARLIDDPGAVFVGSIFGGTGGTAVLELASAGSAGTITSLGTSVTNFTSLVFDSGAQWTVAGNDSANGLGTLGISGFTSGDTIDLTGFPAVSRTFLSNALVLNDGSTGHATLAIQGNFSTASFLIGSDNNGGTDITFSGIVPCFAAGTRIGTRDGAVLVECLHEGDIVLTVSGRCRPIRWIGRRTVDCVRHVSPDRVKPIRIAGHAFGKNLPRRDLVLSPDHCVFVDDVLIPVKHLVNGTTITQLDVPTVRYFHVELPKHDVVLAEGLPVETYLEMGDRSAFENGGGALQLHPDFEADEAHVAMVWESLGYAPAVVSGGQLGRVRARLASRARMLACEAASVARPMKRTRRRAMR